MSVELEAGRLIHMPANPDRFAFDYEVAEIFDDMADRSIPMFRAAHELHARLAEDWMQNDPEIMDVGASRGAFLKALGELYVLENYSIRAIDSSAAMVSHLERDFPMALVEKTDITGRGFLTCLNTYDVINFSYVLQFIKPEMQRLVLGKIVGMLKKGGVLFIGQKNKADRPIDQILQHEYINWRLSNGYTMEEINAKSAALAGSMWPMSEDFLIQDLKSFGITEVTRTCSWGPFSNLMCIKR
jgi:tRNA (cmo5U34)-methyltransferase